MKRLYDATTRLLADPARYFGEVQFEPAGRDKLYVADAGMNLVPGVVLDDIRADMEGGDGNELESKFLAPHSSSALAVNTFAIFRKRDTELAIGRHAGLRVLGFEQKRHHGLSSKRAPNLDMIAEGETVVAVESKFLEYFTPKVAKFSSIYVDEMPEVRRGAWYRHMLTLIEQPENYRRLDAAQLIKHAFGLTHAYPDRNATLLYLYWEPTNANEHALFVEHRDEIAAFAARVAGDHIAFEAKSYPELWREWDARSAPAWLAGHLANLRKRYALTIPV